MRRALVLAYHFPPIGGAGAQRPLKIVRALPDFGYEPIVITGPGPTADRWTPADATLGGEITCEVRRIAAPEPLPSRGWRGRAERALALEGPWASWWRTEAAKPPVRCRTSTSCTRGCSPTSRASSPPTWRGGCASRTSPTSATRGRSTRCWCT